MDPYICCLLGLCCPPNSPEQIKTLANMLMARDVCENYAYAEKVAKFHLELVQQVRDALMKR